MMEEKKPAPTAEKTEKERSLFRKKSLERASSPEQLNDYIRVTNPGMWLVLGAVAALLAGLLLWAAFGRLETKVRVAAVAERGGEACCYVPEAAAEALRPGMTVRIDGAEYTLGESAERPVLAERQLDEYGLHVGGLEQGQWVYPVAVDAALPAGVYGAEIVTDSASPFSFLWN